MEYILFYLFSALVLVSSVIVVTAKNPVHSVLFLVLVFCNATGLLLLLEIEFIAIIFLVVYIGAIAVLFLFVVMMLNIRENAPLFGMQSTGEVFSYIPVGLLLVFVFLLEVFLVIQKDLGSFVFCGSSSLPSGLFYTSWFSFIDGVSQGSSNLETLGQVLYTYYFYFFLVAGLVLLVAVIGAVVLTLQIKSNIVVYSSSISVVKRQLVSQQLSRDACRAVFLVCPS
jgi:NADH-quinone oxidoreductase subunit J